mmetsp:Transcript_3330/g.7411  ORF Transcript_3330/g.7411 Transcript_3330/m.7411 type:complete len:141 (-) Transcript_3330:563-985(-)
MSQVLVRTLLLRQFDDVHSHVRPDMRHLSRLSVLVYWIHTTNCTTIGSSAHVRAVQIVVQLVVLYVQELVQSPLPNNFSWSRRYTQKANFLTITTMLIVDSDAAAAAAAAGQTPDDPQLPRKRDENPSLVTYLEGANLLG